MKRGLFRPAVNESSNVGKLNIRIETIKKVLHGKLIRFRRSNELPHTGQLLEKTEVNLHFQIFPFDTFPRKILL